MCESRQELTLCNRGEVKRFDDLSKSRGGWESTVIRTQYEQYCTLSLQFGFTPTENHGAIPEKKEKKVDKVWQKRQRSLFIPNAEETPTTLLLLLLLCKALLKAPTN